MLIQKKRSSSTNHIRMTIDKSLSESSMTTASGLENDSSDLRLGIPHCQWTHVPPKPNAGSVLEAWSFGDFTGDRLSRCKEFIVVGRNLCRTFQLYLVGVATIQGGRKGV